MNRRRRGAGARTPAPAAARLAGLAAALVLAGLGAAPAHAAPKQPTGPPDHSQTGGGAAAPAPQAAAPAGGKQTTSSPAPAAPPHAGTSGKPAHAGAGRVAGGGPAWARPLAAPSPVGSGTRAASIAPGRRTARAASVRRPAAVRRRAARRRAARRAAARRTATRRAAAAPRTGRPPGRGAPARRERTRPTAAPRRGPAPVARDEPSIVTRTVESIERVIPAWAWALIASLAALLAVASALAGTAAARERRYARQRARLVDQVGLLQAALLPDVPARIGPVAVSVAYRPAEGLAAGGDFYDVFPLDDARIGVLVGDVSGHGREAIGSATFIRHMVRSYLEAGLGPRAALQLAGRVLDDHRRDDFATVVAAVHDRAAGTLSYAAAGHPPPIVVGPAGHRGLVVASSPPLGVGWPTGQRQTTLPLPAGSTVCFYTDGLSEARRGERLIGHARVRDIVEELAPYVSAAELIERIRGEADAVPDDIAVVVLHAREGSVSSQVRVEEVEVTLPELHGARLQRFLEACAVPPDEIAATVRAAAPRVVEDGSVVLRVRMAQDRSGVDILPVGDAAPAAALTALRRS